MENTVNNNQQHLLTCIDIVKSYAHHGNFVPVLKGINFSLQLGESVIIQGKSGAGKSTLMEILGGLSRPDSGKIYLEDQSINTLSDNALADFRRCKIGIIFQNFNLIPSWNAFENVEAALMHGSMSRSERRTHIADILNNIGLDGKSEHLPAELSVGQQQLVAVARALINKPVLILADEPTGEVDAETAQKIIDVLYAPVKEKKATLLITTHGTFSTAIADSILSLQDGILKEVTR